MTVRRRGFKVGGGKNQGMAGEWEAKRRTLIPGTEVAFFLVKGVGYEGEEKRWMAVWILVLSSHDSY